MTYSSLHTHSHFSLDGIGVVKQWVQAIKDKGLYGLAITDHGNSASALELKTLGKNLGVKVLMGCEFYIVKELPSKDYYHITIMIKNYEGYQNLCRLSSLSFHKEDTGPQYHFYKRPRITLEELFTYSKGLIVGSGCLAGPLSKHILSGENDIVDKYLSEFLDVFGEDYYIEVQPSVVKDKDSPDVDRQSIVNLKLLDIADCYNLKTIITPDAHFIDKDQKVLQSIKLNARSGGNWDFDEANFLFTTEELQEKVKKDHPYMLSRLPAMIQTTNEVMDKGQFEMPDFKPLLPNVDITEHPLYQDGDTDKKLLMRILIDNGRIDFGDVDIQKRLKYELEAIVDNGEINLLPYFFVLEDLVRWCRLNKI